MAYISFKPSDFFNAHKYTGTGSSNAVTGVGFSPDAVWIKTTSNGQKPCMFDTVRGVQKVIYPSESTAEITDSSLLTAFGADGFTVVSYGDVNTNTEDFASWNWKAGTTSGLSGGTITPSSYSYNATTGFGIYKWSGTGSAGTIAHGLGKVPQMIQVKRLDTTYSWVGYFNPLGSSKNLAFNLSNAAGNAGVGIWNSTNATNTVFSVGTDDAVNLSGGTYVAYVWCNVAGSSSIGEYIGNGSADGTFVYTGFEPEMIIAKNRDSGGVAAYGWTQISNTFGMGGATTANPAFNELTQNVFVDQLVAAATGNPVDFLSNGFKWRGTGTGSNQSGAPFAYMAFARQPIIGSGGTVGVAR